jgi:hypothetical protein
MTLLGERINSSGMRSPLFAVLHLSGFLDRVFGPRNTDEPLMKIG